VEEAGRGTRDAIRDELRALEQAHAAHRDCVNVIGERVIILEQQLHTTGLHDLQAAANEARQLCMQAACA
jgi:hypothetical protein